MITYHRLTAPITMVVAFAFSTSCMMMPLTHGTRAGDPVPCADSTDLRQRQHPESLSRTNEHRLATPERTCVPARTHSREATNVQMGERHSAYWIGMAAIGAAMMIAMMIAVH